MKGGAARPGSPPIGTFSAARLAGMDRGQVLCGPAMVHIDITNGCNANCITCWDHSPLLERPRSPEWKRLRAEPAAVEAMLDDIGTLGGLQAVILSGMGEPFTHPGAYEIAAAIKRRGLHLTIITNLVLADPDRLLELGVDQLLVGIHGASEASYRAFHPSFRGDEWGRLNDGLARFARAGKRLKHVHVICEPNAHELSDMVRLAKFHDAAQINFKLASLRDGTQACRITAEQRARLADRDVPAALALAADLGVATNLRIFARQLEAGPADTAPIADVGCFMGYEYSRILVDGTVLYCCAAEVVVGSLASGVRFSALWSGPEWNTLRARLHRAEYFPDCGQCGKFNQNVKLAERFEAAFGRERLLAVTGRQACVGGRQ